MSEQIETHRTCSKCGQIKAIDDYYWRNKRTGCRRRECKVCLNIEKSVRSKQDYRENTSYYKEKNSRWFRENGEYMKAKRHERYVKDKDKVRVQERMYKRHKRATDVEFRIKSCLRTRCGDGVRRCRAVKSDHTLKLLGCTLSELRQYLEAKFYGGMTWSDLGNGPGKFQIDHIEPVGLFDLTCSDSQYRCFHYTNLQPLWWEDHQRKTVVDNMRIRNHKEILANLVRT